MRCTSCGVENAPDSRFCGGCGALQAVQPRLAATAKIPDDAPFAPPTRPVAPISPLGGVSYSPPSMPPQPAPAPMQQAGLTTRPGGHSAPPRTSGENAQVRPSGGHGQVERRPSAGFDSITPTAQQQRITGPGTVQRPGTNRPQTEPPRRHPQASNASMSFSAPAGHRSLGLIAFVLIVDLGLAGAGAFLLAKGLSKPTAANAEKAEKPEKKSETPRTGETAVVSADPAGSAAAPSPAAPTPATAVTAVPIEAPPAEQLAAKTGAAARTKTHGTSDKSTSTSTSTSKTTSAGPVTSPGSISGAAPATPVPTPAVPQGPSTESQIGALVNRSQGSFDRCRGDAALAGSIGIAFQVNPDGSITNAAAVENTTGNAEVGQCLARVIAGWRVTPFQGNPMSFMRPFSYP